MRRLSRTPVLAAVAMLGTSALTVSLLAAPAEAGPRKTRVSAALSATSTTPAGVVTLSGWVKDKGKQKRRVILEQKIASGWRTVDKGRSAKDGAYAFTVPTHWFYSTKLRTRVKPTRTNRGSVSRAHRLSVVPAYTPLGSPDAWETLGRSRDRWNPCRTLTYGINTSRATPDAGTVSTGIHNTIALVSQATGVRFEFAGETARTRSTGSGSARTPTSSSAGPPTPRPSSTSAPPPRPAAATTAPAGPATPAARRSGRRWTAGSSTTSPTPRR